MLVILSSSQAVILSSSFTDFFFIVIFTISLRILIFQKKMATFTCTGQPHSFPSPPSQSTSTTTSVTSTTALDLNLFEPGCSPEGILSPVSPALQSPRACETLPGKWYSPSGNSPSNLRRMLFCPNTASPNHQNSTMGMQDLEDTRLNQYDRNYESSACHTGESTAVSETNS